MILRIDKRERCDELYDNLLEIAEETKHTIEDENQDIGDYVWYTEEGDHTGIVVEFKNMDTDDLFKSLRSGHLDSQLLDLCQYPHPILVCAGKFDAKHYRGTFTRKQFLAKMASICVRTGVKPFWFERVTDAAQFIMQLPNQLEKGAKVDVIAHRHSRTRNREDHNLNQFLALPTVGRVRAEELCDTYKTFYAFLKAAEQGAIPELPKGARSYVAAILGVPEDTLTPLLEKWTSIPGIGKAGAEKYINQGLTIDQFISRVDGGIIKVGIHTKRWVEDQIRAQQRKKK